MVKDGKSKLKLILDKPDNRDFTIVSINENTLPNSIDISRYCPYVKRKNEIIYPNTHIIISAIETMMNICLLEQNLKVMKKNYYFKNYIKKNHSDFFSELSLYETTKFMFPKSKTIPFRKILKTTQKYGCAIQDKNLSNVAVGSYKIKNYAKISNTGLIKNVTLISRRKIIKDMKSVLASKVPIITTLKFPTSAKKSKNGLFNYDSEHTFVQPVLIVGYYDNFNATNKGVFIYQNMWGDKWGDKGYGYLPYSHILKTRSIDMWVITEFEFTALDNNKFNKISFNSKDPQCLFYIKS
jgi:hypothetical protein